MHTCIYIVVYVYHTYSILRNKTFRLLLNFINCKCSKSFIKLSAGRYTNFGDGMVLYHRINNYYGILINTFIHPVKYSNNFFLSSDKCIKVVPLKNQKRVEN